MANKNNLPIDVHEHFRKANVLHTYVQKDLGEATKHALETGQELLAAKSTLPHKKWEGECERLFDGSLRTAQFYMQFSRDMGSIKSAARSAVLMLEGTLDGAAKAARKAAIAAGGKKPPKPASTPPDAGPIDVESEPVSEPTEPDYGKCPNCAGSKWDDEDEDDVSCAKCHHPHGEPAGDADEDRIKTQRQKTVKTAEALMRAFDDLHTMKAKPDHEQAIADCKRLLAVAEGWK